LQKQKPIMKSAQALIDRANRILTRLDPDIPGWISQAANVEIADACDYDRGFDTRPDFVQADDQQE
jgi:hypothetical protein